MPQLTGGTPVPVKATCLFGAFDAGESEKQGAVVPDVGEFPERQRLHLEKEALGLFLTGHPFDQFRQELGSVTSGSIADHCSKVEPSAGEGFRRRGRPVTTAGLVLGVRTIIRDSGKMGIVTLDDRTGRLEVVIGPDQFEAVQPMLIKDEVLVVSGDLSFDDFSGGYRVKGRELSQLADVRRQNATSVTIALKKVDEQLFSTALSELFAAREEGSGIIPIKICYEEGSSKGVLWLSGDWRIDPSAEQLAVLSALPGCTDVQLEYAPRRA